MMDILRKQGKAVSSILPKRFKFWHYIFLAASILFSLPASNAHSAQVTLAWDASTDPNTAGYKVHYGNSSRSYQVVIDVGKTPSCTISNLTAGTTYYFAATDYNASGSESAYSNEVSYTASATCTNSISPTSQSAGSSGGPGTVSVTASSGCSWTAISNASWITVTSNGSVTGNGTVNYSVSANSGTTSRTGTMTIAGRTFTVTQSGSSQYTLTINKSGTGTGSVANNPAGTTFNPGTVVNLTATPGAGSTFAGWSGGSTGSSPTCSVTMNGNTSVTAAFTLKTYTITASAGSNGSISPSGTITVNSGANQTFTIKPNTGYQVSNLLVDGASVGSPTSYNFTNVTANHTIQASFVPVSSYTLTVAKAGTGTGAITNSPTGTSFSPGTIVTLTATTDASSTFTGWSGACTGTSPTCTITMNASTSATATFALKTYTITATSDTNGSISPSGSVSVNYGASRTFTITPNSGYQASNVKVDGTSAGVTSSYTFGNVMSNHTIQATFSPGGSSTGKAVIALNAGGTQYNSTAGITYAADRYYSGGRTWGTTAAIAGTTDAMLYQSERYGNFSYSIPVGNGNYTVTLKFAEIYWSNAGRRVFNVKIGGTQVISNLDIFSKVGKNRAYDVAIPVTVVNGILKIDFLTVVDNAKVSAILVQPR